MEKGEYIKEQGRICRGNDNEHIRGEGKCITLRREKDYYQGMRKERYIKEEVEIYYEERETTSYQQTKQRRFTKREGQIYNKGKCMSEGER